MPLSAEYGYGSSLFSFFQKVPHAFESTFSFYFFENLEHPFAPIFSSASHFFGEWQKQLIALE